MNHDNTDDETGTESSEEPIATTRDELPIFNNDNSDFGREVELIDLVRHMATVKDCTITEVELRYPSEDTYNVGVKGVMRGLTVSLEIEGLDEAGYVALTEAIRPSGMGVKAPERETRDHHLR